MPHDFDRNKDQDFIHSLGHGPSLPILEESAEEVAKLIKKYKGQHQPCASKNDELFEEIKVALRDLNQAFGTTTLCREAHGKLRAKLSEREAAVRGGAEIGDAAAHIGARRDLKVTMKREEEAG